MSEFEDKLQSILGNQDAMSQIMSIAQSITGSSRSDDPEEPPATPEPDSQPIGGDLFSTLGNLDPRLLEIGMQLFSEYQSGDNQKAALLTALQPFVKESRYAKVNKAIQIAKLSRIIRLALDAFRKGDGDHV